MGTFMLLRCASSSKKNKNVLKAKIVFMRTRLLKSTIAIRNIKNTFVSTILILLTNVPMETSVPTHILSRKFWQL